MNSHKHTDDIVSNEFEIRMTQPMLDILFRAGKEIVQDGDIVAHEH